VARYRLSAPARADIAAVLRSSEAMNGGEARIRYHALLVAGLRRIADPQGRSTIDHNELFAGVRSFDIRYSRDESRQAPVGRPVHVIYYRMVEPGLIEVVLVLHERVEPRRHLGGRLKRAEY
jgi:toxin ParE1/3/4